MVNLFIRTPLLASVFIGPWAVGTGFAQQADVTQQAFALDDIVISGGLTPVEAEKYGRAASVLTAKEIESRGISNVQDALRAVPGVSVNGSSTSFTQVRIRGGETNHTLVLIDGIKAAGGDSEYNLSGLETANIERIEVLRGPQSVYYGSNASAGVINIITRKGETGSTASGSIEFGSGTTATAFFAHRNPRGGIALSLNSSHDAGYDQSGDGFEKDTLHRNSLALSGDVQATPDIKLGFTLRHSDETSDFDDTPWTAADEASYVTDDPTLFSDRKETSASVYGEYEAMGGRLTQRLAFETTRHSSAQNGATATDTTSRAAKYRLSYGIDGAAATAGHLVNLLLEAQDDSSTSNAQYDRRSKSLALEYRGQFDNGLNLQAGARYDDNDVFSNATTWTLGASYTLAQTGIRLHASAGTGVVNPSYFELYADNYGYTGNPNLKPEENRSFDLGATFPIFGDRGTIDVTYFNETLTGEISVTSTAPGAYTYINEAGDSDRQGIEINAALQATDTLDLRFAYTYIDARNANDTVEIRRPRNEASLGMTSQAFGGRGSISADLRHVSGNYDTQYWIGGTTAKLPAYTTLDLSAQYELTDQVALNGRITNLFNTETSDVWGYANRGRAIYAGLNARF